MVPDPGESDHVEGAVELAVAPSVKAVPALLSARGVDRPRAGERGEGCLARHPAWVTARDQQLRAADRSHAALLEEIRRDLGEERGKGALGVCHLPRESLDALAEPTQNAVRDIGARPQSSRRVGKPLPREGSQTLAQVIGSGDRECVQLVEGGGACLHGAATLEQEQAQVLAPTTAAGNAQALTADQPPRGQTRVDQIPLPPRRSWRRGRSHS